MKKSLFSLAFFALEGLVFGQNLDQKAYFQQRVDTKINCHLDDRRHELTGSVSMIYTNNAPDELGEIFIHLFANAHSKRTTALVDQKVRFGDSKLYFSPDSLLGGYSRLDFEIDDKKAAWKLDKNNPDIARLELAEPLKSGQKITISTPFLLKIPGSWSRLGHVGQSYQMTQWFPKPAVFDRDGWHAMPYLDAGEFFSEFGDYDVEITLPENYVVAATGLCQTESENAFLNKKVAESQAVLDTLFKRAEGKKGFLKKADQTFPKSSRDLKTIRFTAQNVIDFAWFADKRFIVQRDEAVLASGKKVAAWAFFTAENAKFWQKGAFFVKRAVESYSDWVGEYGWPQATAVHSALSAGGGMEYPMITVIGNSGSEKELDRVTAHEVGHNWFQGQLASNERDHAWLDEGVNSFYENRYMDKFWPNSGGLISFKPILVPKTADPLPVLGCQSFACRHRDQAPETTSNEFDMMNYGLQSYMKPAIALHQLELAVGTENFDRTMRDYFSTWKMRHPQPADFEAIWQKSSLEAAWFFEAMRTTKTMDWAIESVKKTDAGAEVFLKNKGDLAAPTFISAIGKDGKTLEEKVVPAALGQSSILLNEKNAPLYIIDNQRVTLDVNSRNHRYGKGKIEPLGLRLINIVDDPTRTVIGVAPWVLGNPVDGPVVGMMFYNAMIPAKKWSYFLSPSVGLKSKTVCGGGTIYRNFFLRNGPFQKITLGLMGRKFGFDVNDEKDYRLGFFRIVPQIEFFKRHHPRRPVSSSFRFRFLETARQTALFRQDTTLPGDPYLYEGKKWRSGGAIPEAAYFFENTRAVNPFTAMISVEGQRYDAAFSKREHYIKVNLEWAQKITFAPKKHVEARLWATYFLKNSIGARNVTGFGDIEGYARGSQTLLRRGYADYRFDEILPARSTDRGLFAQQISTREGGFRTVIDQSQINNIGTTNRFLVALNLTSDLPSKLPGNLPLKPYFDLGAWKTSVFYDNKVEFMWTGGVLLDLKYVRIHFPIRSSDNLRSIEKQRGGYATRISWALNFGNGPRKDMVDFASGFVR